MSDQPKPEREWEHWPGRRAPDDGIRSKLKTLFSPTDGEDAAEALIVDRGREIEERTEQLHETIADLERREERTGRLRSAVEEMLRHGSAELDERHAELASLALELGAREERVRASERDIAVRKQELGAVELRRAAVERREESATEREETIATAADETADRERTLADAERQLAEQREELEILQNALAATQASLRERERRVGDEERRLAGLSDELANRTQGVAADEVTVSEGREELARAVANMSAGLRAPSDSTDSSEPSDPSEALPTSHVLFAADGGYRLLEADGPPPAVDSIVELEGRPLVVTRVGRSPLPGDGRACAYLEPPAARS